MAVLPLGRARDRRTRSRADRVGSCGRGRWKADRHHCAHGEGERRQLHGRETGVALQVADARTAGRRHSRDFARTMRTTFIETLSELADADERLWLLSADLGYSVVERFADRFPGRFVNVGVSEQNMIGIAAGLALSGKTVFTYSIANFATFRCLEQIRNDVCY